MSGNDYAALYATVQARLRVADHGRNGRHAMGGCPKCRLVVCLTHHDCKRGDAAP